MIKKSLCLSLFSAAAIAAGPAQNDSKAIVHAELSSLVFSAAGEQRQLLEYLISCALPAGVELSTDIDGEAVTFRGSFGLAPAWLKRPPSEREQRWVSACLLARTNYFGKSVEISMRAADPAPSALRTTLDERQSFTLFEGAFFGNLFQQPPVAYTCTGTRAAAEAADPILKDRVCTQASETGEAFSRCGFIRTGHCDAADSFRVDNQHYAEAIFVYLRPLSAER